MRDLGAKPPPNFIIFRRASFLKEYKKVRIQGYIYNILFFQDTYSQHGFVPYAFQSPDLAARPPVRPSWITGYQTGLFFSMSQFTGYQTGSFSSISQFTGYQTGSCSSIYQFTGYQHGLCSSISRFTAYQNGSFSNMFIILIDPDGTSI